jgi:hypothetical protein
VNLQLCFLYDSPDNKLKICSNLDFISWSACYRLVWGKNIVYIAKVIILFSYVIYTRRYNNCKKDIEGLMGLHIFSLPWYKKLFLECCLYIHKHAIHGKYYLSISVWLPLIFSWSFPQICTFQWTVYGSCCWLLHMTQVVCEQFKPKWASGVTLNLNKSVGYSKYILSTSSLYFTICNEMHRQQMVCTLRIVRKVYIIKPPSYVLQ